MGIKECTLFSEFSDHELNAVTQIALTRRFGRGEMIFSEGQDGAGFYIVESGRIKIFKLSADGKEIILHIFGPGELFAEAAVFEDHPYPANAEALDESSVVFFPKKRFIELIGQHPRIALRMLAVMTRRLHHFAQLIDDLSLKEVPARLARYLLHLDAESGNSHVVTLVITKAQLAGILGTIPETLSRGIGKLVQSGLITVVGSLITIHDPERLENLSWSGRLEI